MNVSHRLLAVYKHAKPECFVTGGDEKILLYSDYF